MKILITGDTHHKLDKVFEICEKIKGIDLILHTGDYAEDGRLIQKRLGIRTVCVPGNCDGISSFDYEIVEAECGRILLTHGHKYGVDYSYDRLLYLAEENNCMAAVFGHTHIPVYEEYDGIMLINPGSLSRPRDGSSGSYAILTATESTAAASICYYNNSSSKPKGGFIKGMLNYSDRF